MGRFLPELCTKMKVDAVKRGDAVQIDGSDGTPGDGMVAIGV